jgi:hypothetical protein
MIAQFYSTLNLPGISSGERHAGYIFYTNKSRYSFYVHTARKCYMEERVKPPIRTISPGRVSP